MNHDQVVRWACMVYGTMLLTGSTAQNLVPNGDFESYTGPCPGTTSYGALTSWTEPGCADRPEYNNACNVGAYSLYGVPNNGSGTQAAYSGNGYVGMLCFDYSYPQGNPRTYMTMNLSTPLVAGQDYCLRMWFSLADTSSFKLGQLQALITYGLPDICNNQDHTWASTAQITLNTSQVNTTSWQMAEGSYTAAGGETAITIGQFRFGADIDTTFIDWVVPPYISVYYIDDVYFGLCSTIGIESISNEEGVHVFPDPVGDQLHIELGRGWHGGGIFELLCIEGRLVQSFKANEGPGTLGPNMQGLTAGLYLLRYKEGDRRWEGIVVKE